MLRLDRNERKFVALSKKAMNQVGLLERGDLQQMIRQSPDAFFQELGEELKLIGEEVKPAAFVDDRIDLLAIDKLGRTVVIELKRGTHKLHLLQALAYAAMVSKWPASRIAEEYSRFTAKSIPEAEEEIDDFLDEDASRNLKQEIILLAEDFDFEVLITAEWLTEKYEVDIRCYRLLLAVEDHAQFLTCACVYPPPEITKHAITRRGFGDPRPTKWADWEQALKAIENPAVVDFFRKELAAGRENNLRKRILRYRTNGKRRLLIAARQKLAYVRQYRRFSNDEQFWKEALGPDAQVKPVRDARSLRFYLKTKEEFAAFSEAVKKLASAQFANDADTSEDEEAEE
jgi:hypothetical protein